jgi:hypothetical protein
MWVLELKITFSTRSSCIVSQSTNNCSIFVVPDSPLNDGHLPAPAPKEEEESEDDPTYECNHDPDAPKEWGPDDYND